MPDVESYYRTAVYAPLLDNVLTDLKSRFTVEAEKMDARGRRRKGSSHYRCGSTGHVRREIFPLIHTFLQILATLPVSVASAERSFSALRRLKTWMRSQMGEERLTGLALLHAHRDITIDTSKVIERFATKCSGQRRLELVI
ncbi:uncharacterized protein LOC125758225 [Rhipicephalus sanguineus]|uniref:uncharacterized protein LOC125758225 n=1 Tax=Rhipicephalus sanguineus TaxID=34632 RepID=UPI0020C4D98E|nr:uncharacterized protein LOC125758225 [Rhipicephalus sanguineus]